jgi:hypothetical protein
MKLKILIIIVTLIMGIYGSAPTIDNNVGTHARMFCAYNKMFIEFDDGKNTWGTIWLDQDGRPVACRDDKNISSRSLIL